jgi:hypothetical protein
MESMTTWSANEADYWPHKHTKFIKVRVRDPAKLWFDGCSYLWLDSCPSKVRCIGQRDGEVEG